MSVFPAPWTFSGIVPSITKDFGTFDCQSFTHVRIIVFSNADYEIFLRWSTDFGVNVDYTDASTVQTGGNSWTASVPIRARFLNVGYTDATAVGGRTLRLQVHLNDKAPGLSSLVNLGSGAEIFEKQAIGLRSLVCSNASITITENPTEIDLVVSGGGGGPYQQVIDDITPISASVNAIVSGSGNTIDPATLDSFIGGSLNCTTVGSGPSVFRVGFLASQSCSLSNRTRESAFVACDTCAMGTGGGTNENDVIIAAKNSTIQNIGGKCRAIIASENCSYSLGAAGGSQACGFIAGSEGCVLEGNNSINNFILGSTNSKVRKTFATVGGEGNGVIACNLCNHGGTAPNGQIGGYNTLMSCNASYCDFDETNYSSIIASDNSFIRSRGNYSAIIASENATIQAFHQGSVIMSTGTALVSSAANEFTVKKAGGTRVYSNDLATTGVTLAPGANSWAAVSDVNLKENLNTFNGSEALAKFENIPVYKYNFIGNPAQQCNIGPTAQDWHAQFACADIMVPLLDGEGNQMLDAEGDPMFTAKPAKSKLKIEVMDMLGASIAAIKELNDRLKVAEKFKVDVRALNLPALSSIS